MIRRNFILSAVAGLFGWREKAKPSDVSEGVAICTADYLGRAHGVAMVVMSPCPRCAAGQPCWRIQRVGLSMDDLPSCFLGFGTQYSFRSFDFVFGEESEQKAMQDADDCKAKAAQVGRQAEIVVLEKTYRIVPH